MTVSSLWSALEGSGRPVGLEEFHLRSGGGAHQQSPPVQPSQYAGNGQNNVQTILAVDLSIWICEGLASTALSSFHSDPALHLVYQRTIKLLKLGLGLIFVVEGKRRVRLPSSSQTHGLSPRRSGTQFWSASERCESLLRLLGVPVVRAEAEGEALCALLNVRGIVDGVISNDGDCFLFGAKKLYTKFTVENLENRRVMCYDASRLAADLEVNVCREDLIAFALLTGSDMVGSGVPNVGYRKAIQFIRICRSLKQQPNHRTCLDELLSWGDIAAASGYSKFNVEHDFCNQCDDDGPSTISTKCCTICCHSGNKRNHERDGCNKCGTSPGEGCIARSSEKFLCSIKEKALGMASPFAPRDIVKEYFAPNYHIVPSALSTLQLRPFTFTPNAQGLFDTSLTIRGNTSMASKEYLRETLPHLLARLEVWKGDKRNRYATTNQKFTPIPVKIEKGLVKQFWQCYEISWTINLAFSAGCNEQFSFSTLECQSMVNLYFPLLVKSFHQEERRKEQHRNESDRRKIFTGMREHHGHKRKGADQRENMIRGKTQPAKRNRRERNFDISRVVKNPKHVLQQNRSHHSHDIAMLMDNLPDDNDIIESDDFDEQNILSQPPSRGVSFTSKVLGETESHPRGSLRDGRSIQDSHNGDSQYLLDTNRKIGCYDNYATQDQKSNPQVTFRDGRYQDSRNDEAQYPLNTNFEYPLDTNRKIGCYDNYPTQDQNSNPQVTLRDGRYQDSRNDEAQYPLNTNCEIGRYNNYPPHDQMENGDLGKSRASTDENSDRNYGLPLRGELESIDGFSDFVDIFGRESPCHQMTLFSPTSNRERIFCDMGIKIEMTPIVSGR